MRYTACHIRMHAVCINTFSNVSLQDFAIVPFRFVCRKSSSAQTKSALLCRNGHRIGYGRRNKRLHEFHELLQRIWNVSGNFAVWFCDQVCSLFFLTTKSFTDVGLLCFRFADEVNGEIPEVDCRGRLKRFVKCNIETLSKNCNKSLC